MARYITFSGREILVDDEDFELISQYKWNVNKLGYAQSYVKGSGRKNHRTISMHRLIMNFPEGKLVDHINRNKVDNRRENLRICDKRQNAGNSIGYSKKTQYKGLDRMPNGSWRARLQIDGKTKHLGIGKTEEEASAIYNKAALAYYGEFALLNNKED